MNELRGAFQNYNGHPTLLKDNLYGLVYYFFNIKTTTDADNISKPIWDCLTKYLFQDDNQVKLRIAGCIDLKATDFKVLDFTGIPPDVTADLVEALENEEHIVYIECGTITDNLFRFNLEAI